MLREHLRDIVIFESRIKILTGLLYESELLAQLIPKEFHPKLHFLTHQPNEQSDNNAYKAIPLFDYLYV